MSHKNLIRSDLSKRLHGYQAKPRTWVGVIGDVDGNLYPDPTDRRFIYVRDFDGIRHEVLNQRVPSIPGYAVRIGSLEESPDLEEAIGLIQGWGVAPPVKYVGSHAETHEFGAYDMLWAHGEQILPWAAKPSGMTLVIIPAAIYTSVGWIAGSPTPIDLTSYVPTSGSVAALITVKADGTLGVTVGGNRPPELLALADLPATPAGEQPIWAVKLINHMTTIEGVQNGRWKYLTDLRWGFAPPASGGSIGLSDGATSVDPTRTLNLTPDVFAVENAGAGVANVSLNGFPPFLVEDAIAAQKNNYNPTGYDADTRVLKISAATPQNITGLAGGVLRRNLYFYNAGPANLTFKDLSGSSDAAKQFNTWGAGDKVLTPGNVIRWQYDTGDNWFFVSTGAVSSIPFSRLMIADAVGRMSNLSWAKVNATVKKIIFGDTEGVFDDIVGGVALGVVDDQGNSGGEFFVGAAGTGTGTQPANEYAGRYWGVRWRGTKANPTQLLNGDVILDVIAMPMGDDGNLLTAAELAAGDSYEAHQRGFIRFVADGDQTDANRAVKIEVWLVPAGSTTAAKAMTFQSEGDLNMEGHKIVALADPTSDQEAATRKYVDDHAGGGAGDMLKATYDTDNDGVVDNSEALGGAVLSTDGTLGDNSDAKVPSQKAVKTYADGLIAAVDAMVYKGVIDCSGNPNYPAADAGWTYRISVAGKIGGASGVVVEIGDIVLCIADATASGNQATVGAYWDVIQANLGVVGSAAGLDVDTDGTLAANSDAKIATQKATKTYVDAHALTWSVITADQTAVVNNGYVCNKGTLLTLTLPAVAAVGDKVHVAGMNVGLWKIAQAASVSIKFGNQTTATGTGGYLASTLQYDVVELVCIVANTTWMVLGAVGNITVA